MHECYHIDVAEPELLRSRSSRWLRVRILGLLDVSSRLSEAVARKAG